MSVSSTSPPTPSVTPGLPCHEISWVEYLRRWLTTIAAGSVKETGESLQLAIPRGDDPEDAVDSIVVNETSAGHVLQWLSERIEANGRPLAARPADRPVALHEITPKLFDAYTIDGGQMHVSGCQMEDRPFVLVSHVDTSNDPPRIRQLVFDAEGKPVADSLIERLGFWASVACGSHAPRVAPDLARQSVSAAKVAAAELGEIHSAVLLLPRWASGAVEFEIGEAEARVEFADWAAGLIPPPIIGPQTGEPTYHLAATHDGRLAGTEQLACCSQTGHRWLQSELVKCASTDQLFEESLTAECPVTGERSHKSAFEACSACRQSVSRASLSGGECGCCRDLAPASPTESPLADAIARYPKLGSYRRYRFGQTRDAVVIEASGVWQRLLVVLDRQSLDILHVATGTPFTRQWNSRHKSEYEKLVGNAD